VHNQIVWSQVIAVKKKTTAASHSWEFSFKNDYSDNNKWAELFGSTTLGGIRSKTKLLGSSPSSSELPLSNANPSDSDPDPLKPLPKRNSTCKKVAPKKKFKSASFVDSDDVADMMDSKPLAVTDGNVLVPSSETTASQDERLMFYYPFTGKYQEHVLVRDVKRLDGPIFLNDIIMNFYIKYVSLLLLCTASTQRLISLLFTGAFVTLSHHLLSTMSTSLILFF
jgi:hypothetical protein